MEPIHFFRSGKHTTSAGREITFTQSDLAAIAANYDPVVHEAPIVVGHPQQDAPAYGWISSVVAKPDGLHAVPESVNPEFAGLVRAGTYKKVSGSFYAPDAKNNPKPGSYYLRHVGFLGAAPPAIKGLTPISFSDEADGSIDFDEGILDLREHRLNEREAEFRRSETKSILQRYAGEARILFADVEPLCAFIASLRDDGVVEFSDDDGTLIARNHREWMVDFLSRRLPMITTGEICKGEAFAEDEGEFTPPAGYSVDPQSADLHLRALHHQRKHGGSYEGAVRAAETQSRSA